MNNLKDCTKAAQKLQKQLKKSEEKNLAKSYFLAQASHDLHQPIQALQVFIYNLQNTKLNKEQKEIVQKIDETTNNFNNLLDNLLDISKIESGGLKLQASQFDVDNLLHSIIDEIKDIATSQHIEIKQYIRCNTNIISDPVLVERIIRNLLSNALKYTKDKILIGCRRYHNAIKITICDNGQGISLFDLPHIFDDFFQSDYINNNRKHGAGLGLPIVRKITKFLGGTITVRSLIKKGSCFIVKLPLK